MKEGKVAPLIKEYYPEYYVWNEYPVSECIPFKTVEGEYGVLGNFAPTPLIVEGIEFVNAEQLFQILKFKDIDTIRNIYLKRGLPIKWAAKSAETKSLRREDWGKIIVDVMKFCLQTKYDQSPSFRETLQSTKGFTIVEDQTSKTKKSADTWGVIKIEDKYIGSNLMGRLLMELRETGNVSYHLPQDIFNYIHQLK